jgi:hypothetical protein
MSGCIVNEDAASLSSSYRPEAQYEIDLGDPRPSVNQ